MDRMQMAGERSRQSTSPQRQAENIADDKAGDSNRDVQAGVPSKAFSALHG